MALLTLKKRSEFLRLRGGSRWQTPCFVLETKPQLAPADRGPRFGFTVTKALGSAVVRNRIRRRLKSAVMNVVSAHARPGHDYVVVARAGALDRPFEDLKKDLEQALQRVHHATGRRKGGHP